MRRNTKLISMLERIDEPKTAGLGEDIGWPTLLSFNEVVEPEVYMPPPFPDWGMGKSIRRAGEFRSGRGGGPCTGKWRGTYRSTVLGDDAAGDGRSAPGVQVESASGHRGPGVPCYGHLAQGIE